MYRIGLPELVEVAKVLWSGQLSRQGEPGRRHLHEVDRFEAELAKKIGTRYALCLSGGGSAALVCGLVGLGIGPGDEVIVPAYTWIASAAAVLSVGAIPVIAEIDDTLSIDPDDVERKISPSTRAIIPVHMRGRPANLDRLMGVARAHDLKVLEDCCQSDGGSYRSKRLGSWGDAGAFSFNHWKLITCGEGGALVTDDRAIYERALVFHDNATAFRPAVVEELSIAPFLGQQYRASEIMGAILRVQLGRLDGILLDLRRVLEGAERGLEGVRGVKVAPKNDRGGDCGVVLALQFADEERARAFSREAGGYLPIDTERHVYSNWTPILEKRVMHHPDMNPFHHPKNQGLRTSYAKDMCPRSLEVLRRTVLIELSPEWSKRTVRRNVAAWRAQSEKSLVR